MERANWSMGRLVCVLYQNNVVVEAANMTLPHDNLTCSHFASVALLLTTHECVMSHKKIALLVVGPYSVGLSTISV